MSQTENEMDTLPADAVRVLDKGFVRVVDTMGGDEAIVQAARVSYGKGTKTPSDDRTLLRYMMRHRHTSPFEMAVIKFHVKVPMDAWRQWIRHRTASVSEYSTRYSEAIDEKMETAPDAWRLQSGSNKQGSDGMLPVSMEDALPFTIEHPDPLVINLDGSLMSLREQALHELTTTIYQERLRAGVAREQARKDLPLSTYTMAYWKMDLHNLFHFLSLRMDSHAQLEIRQYANAIGELVKAWCPLAWEAFVDYRLGAVTFSRQEMALIRAELAEDVAKRDAVWNQLSKREQDEFGEKMK